MAVDQALRMRDVVGRPPKMESEKFQMLAGTVHPKLRAKFKALVKKQYRTTSNALTQAVVDLLIKHGEDPENLERYLD